MRRIGSAGECKRWCRMPTSWTLKRVHTPPNGREARARGGRAHPRGVRYGRMRRAEPVARPTLPLGATALGEDSHATDLYSARARAQSGESGGGARLADDGSRARGRGWPGDGDDHPAVPRHRPLPPQPITNPCTGAPGTLTATAHTGVFHTTSFTTGPEFWITSTAEGTATFTPDDPHGVTASGHFAEWFGVSLNNRNEVQHDTSTFQLKGTDGSHIVVQEVVHFSINANGVVTVNFDNVGVHCG